MPDTVVLDHVAVPCLFRLISQSTEERGRNGDPSTYADSLLLEELQLLYFSETRVWGLHDTKWLLPGLIPDIGAHMPID